MTRHLLAAVLAAAAIPSAAFAHGGSYGPAAPAAPAGPSVPPGTADPAAPVTRWETWWAANKEYFLRLGEEMRQEDGPVSEGLTGKKPKTDAGELREKRDAAVREKLVPLFVEALTDDSFEVRTAAAIALGKTGSADGSKPLRDASVKDRHKDVRDSAILALGLLGRQEAIPFLDARLADEKENQRNRSFAAFALGLIGGEDAAASLLSFADGRPDRPSTFSNQQPPLIASTFVAMGLTSDRMVLPTLRAALASPRYDDAVRAFVILSLGRMTDRDSLADIGRILATAKDTGLRRSAAIALGKIAKVNDLAAVEALLHAAKDDPDEVVRQFSAIALGGIADEAITARLEKLFADASNHSRPFLALALAREPDDSIKSGYCIALALLGDKESVPLIEKQLNDRGKVWLQGYAALSLGMLRNVPSAEMLNTRLVSENDPRLRAKLAVGLGLLHDPRAKEWLVATLKKGDGTVYERGGAAMALGVLRMNEAVDDISAVYKNKKEQDMVRAFSVVSLGLIADPSPVPKLARFAIDNNYGLSVDPLNEVLSIL
jgi:HEAT repeat protein